MIYLLHFFGEKIGHCIVLIGRYKGLSVIIDLKFTSLIMRKEGTSYRNIMENVWDKVKFAKKCIKATTTSRGSV